MTNEEAKVFLDNLKICINEHPIVADWLVEIANRKTEPQIETKTETKNSNLTFEKRTMRDCYNCKRYETEGECIECHYEPKDEPQDEQQTIRCPKCGRTDYIRDLEKDMGVKGPCFKYKCINCNTYIGDARLKQAEKPNNSTTEDCSTVEPQTCSVNGRPYTDCCNCEHFKCTADEPQTELKGSKRLLKGKTEPQTENPCDGCVCDDGKHLMYCMNCKGIAWKTEPPKIEDEPQTERSSE